MPLPKPSSGRGATSIYTRRFRGGKGRASATPWAYRMTARAYHAWPRMMLRATAAAYCDMPIAEFERGVAAGTLPLPFKVVDRQRWSRVALDEAFERLAGERADDWRAKSKLYSEEGPYRPKTK